MKPTPDRNPILTPRTVKKVRVEDIQSPTVFRRNTPASRRRELRELRRRQSAAEAIAGIDRTVEIFGFTKGQFSMLDLLVACLEITGPAFMSISTWTAARKEIATLAELRDSGLLTGTRWLVDFTFARRDPAAANQIRKTFGVDSIRVAQNHAKFAIFQNADWRMVIRTSMNLNMNPRFEDFTIAHDPALADFLDRILDEIWTKQKRTLSDAKPCEIRKHFATDL